MMNLWQTFPKEWKVSCLNLVNKSSRKETKRVQTPLVIVVSVESAISSQAC